MFGTLEAVRAQLLRRNEGHPFLWRLPLKCFTSVEWMCLTAVATAICFDLVSLWRRLRWWLPTIVDVHCVFRNVHFLIWWQPFVLGIVIVVELLGFAADWVVSDVCMLVHKTNKIRQSWEMLALCFQVTGQCGKLVLKWLW